MATQPLPFDDVKRFAVRLGTDPELVQGRSGTVSVKESGLMWVRAEAASLAIAEQSDIFIPLRLDKVLSGIGGGLDDPCEQATLEAEMGHQIDKVVRPLPFTALESLFAQCIVAQVTPPDLLAITAEADAGEILVERLDGLHWAYAPFAPPGAPLNRDAANALGSAPEPPEILIVSHWGAVIGGADCEAVESSLRELKRRIVRPARPAPAPDNGRLTALLARDDEWRLPAHGEIHALGCDELSFDCCSKGLLTLGQAMTLGLGMPVAAPDESLWQAALRYEKGYRERPGYLIVPGAGVVAAADLTPQTEALLAGFARMTLRLQNPANLAPFTVGEIAHFLD